MELILLFDGYCLLCQSSVHFILRNETDHEIRFASLQSDISKEILSKNGIDQNYVDSIVFIHEDQCLLKSDAALTLASYLKAPWSWIRYLICLPRFLRDPVYNWVARNRDHWFGRNTSCMVPSSELRERFLDE